MGASLEGFTSYSVDNDEKFAAAIKRAQALVSDLSLPLSLIRGDFYKSQKAIFQLSGPGKYPDLADSTKASKARRGLKIYPILSGATRALEESTTIPSSKYAFNSIVDKKTLILGSLVPYGVYHQSDRPRKNLPQRKYFFIGPEAPKFASSDQIGRLQRWLGILNDYVAKKVLK